MRLDVVRLHRELVGIPSVSGDERAIADFVEQLLVQRSVDVERLGNSVIARAGAGPSLVLNSHLDTVPPQDGWATDPFTPTCVDNKIIGLGANDAKASVAALLVSFLQAIENEPACTLTLMLVEGEETLGIGTKTCLDTLRERKFPIDAAVIGEPTNLAAGIGQFGLAIFKLIARGTACHAAHAKALGITNPIVSLARDIATLAELDLGESTLQPTVLQGAQAKNQVPETALAWYDLRLAPPSQAEEVLDLIRPLIRGEIELYSDRLLSYAMPVETRFWQCLPDDRFVSRTMSDQVFFQGIPAVKIGPGRTERSHTANEFILTGELEAGVAAYSKLIQRFKETYS